MLSDGNLREAYDRSGLEAVEEVEQRQQVPRPTPRLFFTPQLASPGNASGIPCLPSS